MVKRAFNRICCLLLVLLSFVLTLTACNTKIKFKVDFVVDGEVYDTIDTSGQEIIQIPDDPEKEGYIFYGWYLDQDTWEKLFTANSLLDTPLSSNMCVYAKWKTIPSNDTQAEFDTFEKTGEYAYSLTVSNATETLSLETLVSVHALSSWTLSTDADGNQAIANKIATLTVGDNTYYVLVKAEDNSTQLYTLKIRRKAMYEVVFDVAGGTSVENQQVEEGGLAIAPETTRVGYDFSAWNYDFTAPITENKTIVASWTIQEYTITYDLKGGSVATANPGAYNVESGEITLTSPTREGYTFDGWTGTDVSELTTSVIIATGSVGNREYVASWTIQEYTITYDLKGGSVATANPGAYNVESGEITLTYPTREGYMFCGWYTSSNFEADSKVVVIPTGSTGDLKLYAKWMTDIVNEGNLTGVTITQTQSPYVKSNDYSSVSTYSAFTAIAKPKYLVPGLTEGIVPQGMDVWDERDLLFISGYFYNNTQNTSGSPSSMFLVVDLRTGNLWGKYCVKNLDGTYHKGAEAGHMDGVAITEKNIFTCHGSTIYRIPLSQIEELGKSGTLQIVEEIKVPTNAANCNYSDGILWVGDFGPSTITWKHMTNSVGGAHTAAVVGYKVKDTESGFSSENWDPSTMPYATPDYVLSITDKIQGFTFVGDKIVLSQSYGRNNNSKILVYKNVLETEQHTSVTLNGKSLPVWFLDSNVLVKSYTAIPMSEGVTSHNGKLLIVFESGTKRYYNGKNPTDHVWSMTL